MPAPPKAAPKAAPVWNGALKDTQGGTPDSLDLVPKTAATYGVSLTNPQDLKQNCVSCCLTRMENYRNVNDFWKATVRDPPPNRPLTLEETIKLTRRTGWEYNSKKFKSTPAAGSTKAYTAWQYLDKFYLHKLPPYDDTYMLLFRLPNGRGHAINLHYTACPPTGNKVPGIDKMDYMAHWKFRDYQHSDNGEAFNVKVLQSATEIIVMGRYTVVGGDSAKAQQLYNAWKARGKALPPI
ncbi:hypothetical protein J7T55_005730 [Diaporthe amygdali]|uniref:uncharacterized protein n=1 Tax=Phomopsis amygdali TaxID=1214568 RepID=UPI0022FE1D9A|nr:uncharacterized protein J7T55_005730 [Diaporthe amygdali]KAJ0124392.1 hypothetical protein J7T55_005730 [Diaporthe amygdali]